MNNAPTASSLFISWGPGELRAVLTRKDRVIELGVARDAEESLVGAIFLARVTRIVPALPGLFAELSAGVPVFVPGTIAATEGASLILQVTKDAHSDKPAEATTTLIFQGESLDFTPTRPGIRWPAMVDSAAKATLEGFFREALQGSEGINLRRASSSFDRAHLESEIATLRDRHNQVRTAAAGSGAPTRLDQPIAAPLRLLASFLRENLARVVVDDAATATALRSAFPQVEILSPRAFREYLDIDAAFEEALALEIPLPSGGRLSFEATAVGTLIDVDLGTSGGPRRDSARAVLATNLEAAAEIVRQLRLRNVAGAVIVDFISMRSREDREKVAAVMVAAPKDDPVPTIAHGWTRLGHFELTRQRRCASIAEQMLSNEMVRHKRPETIAYDVLRTAVAYSQPARKLVLRVHPAVADRLSGKLAAALGLAADRAGRKIELDSRKEFALEQFDIGSE